MYISSKIYCTQSNTVQGFILNKRWTVRHQIFGDYLSHYSLTCLHQGSYFCKRIYHCSVQHMLNNISEKQCHNISEKQWNNFSEKQWNNISEKQCNQSLNARWHIFGLWVISTEFMPRSICMR